MTNRNSTQERINLLDQLPVHKVEHFGRPLKDHLIGTHNLLDQWGCSEALCLAGLFHSVYGTGTFKTVTLAAEHRQQLRSLIGEYAESLVYIYCMSDRKKLLMENQSPPFYWVSHNSHEQTRLSRDVLVDLIALEAANYVEQLPFGTVKTDAVFHDMRIRFESVDTLMTKAARKAVKQMIDSHAHLFSPYSKNDS